MHVADKVCHELLLSLHFCGCGPWPLEDGQCCDGICAVSARRDWAGVVRARKVKHCDVQQSGCILKRPGPCIEGYANLLDPGTTSGGFTLREPGKQQTCGKKCSDAAGHLCSRGHQGRRILQRKHAQPHCSL